MKERKNEMKTEREAEGWKEIKEINKIKIKSREEIDKWRKKGRKKDWDAKRKKSWDRKMREKKTGWNDKSGRRKNIEVDKERKKERKV